MSYTNQQKEGQPAEQQDLEQQQKDLFRELSREQQEAERALDEEEQEGSISGRPPRERGDQ